MTHDEKCEWRGNYTDLGYEPLVPCGCADRAIAAARREGRIEGYLLADSQWNAEYGPGDPLSRANRDEAADAVDIEWPEDKP